MAFKGPLRNPDSRRGQIEEAKEPTVTVQEQLVPPSWLTTAESAFFFLIVDRQRSAGVGIRDSDTEPYARYARLSLKFQATKAAKQLPQLQRCLAQLEAQLSIGEKERKRLGVKVAKQDTNPMAKLIRMPTGTNDVRRD